MKRGWCIAVCFLLSARMGAMAQPSAEEWGFDAWKFDQIMLRSGKTVDGLIESETPTQVRMLEIQRPPGRGAFGVGRPLERAEIAEIRRLTPAQRQATREAFERYVQRGRIEAVPSDELTLTPLATNAAGWQCSGSWYTLQSHASQELTRRLALRLEQMFIAYRRLLPPRVKRRPDLRIVIFGASAEYRALAGSLGVPLENAAFYHPERNLVAAGSDLARLSAQLSQVQTEHNTQRGELERLRRELPQRMEQRRKQLSVPSVSETARRKALVTYRRQIEQEISLVERRLTEYDRQNETTIQQEAGRVLALLHHEAFHAYLENYVYPQAQFEVPRWLNEGLAQIFEKGVWEAGTLRVDLVDKATLLVVAADLAANPSSLAQVLAADHRSFLMAHGGQRGNQTNYAYAYALAHYLTLVAPVVGSQALDEYVARENGRQEPLARFERLVDQPYAAFETQWRAWISQKTGKN